MYLIQAPMNNAILLAFVLLCKSLFECQLLLSQKCSCFVWNGRTHWVFPLSCYILNSLPEIGTEAVPSMYVGVGISMHAHL